MEPGNEELKRWTVEPGNEAADNINLFLDTVDEALRDREYKDFNDSLNTKVKLNLYKSFCKEIEFKNYLQGVGDPGTRLLFKFRSGTNGLNEELGRHRGKNDDRQCKLCRGECESVVHVLWECPAYDSIRNNFMVELENLLGGRFGEFSTLDNFNKASYILGFENWNRDNFKALLKLVKSFVLLIWETRIVWWSGLCGLWLFLLLSSDWRSYKLRLRLWVRGQWRKRYGSNMSILLLLSYSRQPTSEWLLCHLRCYDLK